MRYFWAWRSEYICYAPRRQTSRRRNQRRLATIVYSFVAPDTTLYTNISRENGQGLLWDSEHQALNSRRADRTIRCTIFRACASNCEDCGRFRYCTKEHSKWMRADESYIHTSWSAALPCGLHLLRQMLFAFRVQKRPR